MKHPIPDGLPPGPIVWAAPPESIPENFSASGHPLLECALDRLIDSPSQRSTLGDGCAAIVALPHDFGAAPLDLLNRCHEILLEHGALIIVPPPRRSSTTDRSAHYLGALALHCGFVIEATSKAESTDTANALTLRKSGLPRWRVSTASPVHLAGWQHLFSRAFGSSISPQLWEWKYGAHRGRAVAAWRGTDPVAYYGSMVRRIIFRGQSALALEICDVMVDPADRAVMTKKGAFFHVTSAFLEMYFGYGSDHLIAFGFPNVRHVILAERMGLYAEVERLVEVAWPPLEGRAPLTSAAQHVKLEQVPDWLLQDLWERMRRDLIEAIAVVRDPAYLRYRYQSHPERQYEILLIKTRLTGAPRGLIVLRRDERDCKLMDIIGPLHALPTLIAHARRQVAEWGMAELTAWITSSKASLFTQTGGTLKQIEACIPTNVWSEGPPVDEMRNRWWLTMGDTDFL